MKKYAFFSLPVFLLFSFSQSIFSQVKIGPLAGGGKVASNYQGDLDLSGYLGLTVEVPISKVLSIQTGAGWNNRTLNSALFSESDIWFINSIVVPAAIKYNFDWDGGQLYFKTGGFVGHLVNPRYIYGGVRADLDFVRLEYGLLFGGGLLAKSKWVHLFVEIESRPGLNDLTDKNDNYDVQVTTTEFIRVGVLVPIAKSKK